MYDKQKDSKKRLYTFIIHIDLSCELHVDDKIFSKVKLSERFYYIYILVLFFNYFYYCFKF
jgi:hypothetical protein